MAKLSLRLIFSLLVGALAIALAGSSAKGESAGAPAPSSPACVGTITLTHQIGQLTAEEWVLLPEECQIGKLFLTAESENLDVVATGHFHQGHVIARTRLFEPPVGLVTIKVNYLIHQ
ncbi:MAG: hypothetical protein L0332_06815 [Chloroflexi bacterium]|nr:hypothetical protein [Chloroflexota bacterium]